MDSHRFPHILGQPEPLWEEHEGTGQKVVQLAVSVPILAVRKIFRTVSRPGAVGVLHYSVEDVADDHRCCKGGIRRAREDIVEAARPLFSALVESVLGAW